MLRKLSLNRVLNPFKTANQVMEEMFENLGMEPDKFYAIRDLRFFFFFLFVQTQASAAWYSPAY